MKKDGRFGEKKSEKKRTAVLGCNHFLHYFFLHEILDSFTLFFTRKDRYFVHIRFPHHSDRGRRIRRVPRLFHIRCRSVRLYPKKIQKYSF